MKESYLSPVIKLGKWSETSIDRQDSTHEAGVLFFLLVRVPDVEDVRRRHGRRLSNSQ